jgi:hypothetical protein
MSTGHHEDLEARLRVAYQLVTATVRPEGIRPSVLPQPVRRGRRLVAFAPVAAALAVVAVLAGAVMLPRLLPAAGPAASGQAGQRFTLVLATANHSGAEQLLLEAAGTSRVAAVVAAPPGTRWAGVASTGNGTTFVAAAADSRACTSRLYYITPPQAGRPAGLTPVPVPVIAGVISYPTALAVSADGRTIAYASAARGPETPMGIDTGKQACGLGSTVLSVAVAGGPVRKRTLTSEIMAINLSLSADGSLLSYIADTADPAVGNLAGLWLQPAGPGPGTELPAGRHLLADTGSIFAAAGVFPASGKTIYIITFRPGNYGKTTFTLSEYQTADGVMLRTVHAWPASMMSPRSLTITGNQLLYLPVEPPDTGYGLDLGSGRATSFPVFVPPGYSAFAVAW